MFIDLLKKRRSIRRFSGRSLSEEQVETLLMAGLLSPSSRRISPWEFVLVRDTEMLDRLSQAKAGAEFLAGAAAGVVVIADTTKSDVWVEDCSIAASNMLLAAADMGLGACWAQIRNRRHASSGGTAEDFVREALSIPPHMAVEAIIGAGHPAEHREPLREEDADWSKVHRESYSGR